MNSANLAFPEKGAAWSPPRRKFRMRQRSLSAVLPLALLLYACFLPQEVHIDIAGQTIFAYRATCMLLVPWLLVRIFQRKLRFNLCDVGVLLTGVWMVVSFVSVYGRAEGVVRGGALAFDLLIPYLIARNSIGSISDLRRLLVVAAPGLALVAVVMVVESVSHMPLARPFAASIFGSLPTFVDGKAVGDFAIQGELRLGLLRAYGPFSHPILAGVFLASFLPLYFNSGLLSWPNWAGRAAGFASFFSLSSAALLSLLVFGILQTYRWLVDRITFVTWKIFIGFSSLLLAGLQLVTANGVIPYLSQFTLTPGTAFYRRLIWRYGSESVAENPWFGIGYEGYERMRWMPESVDAHWLMLAIRHGLLPSFIMLAVVIAIIALLSRRSMSLPPSEKRMCFGFVSAMTVFLVAGFTVSYFGSTGIWFAAFLGIGVSLSASLKPKMKTRPGFIFGQAQVSRSKQ